MQAGDNTIPTHSIRGLDFDWAGFRMDTLFSPLIVFSARIPKSPQQDQVIFAETLTNVGQGWHPNNNSFTADTAGLYFFSFSAALEGLALPTLTLAKNGAAVSNAEGGMSALLRATDESLLSKSCLLQLAKGDVITLLSHSNPAYTGSVGSGADFKLSGFFYKPNSNVEVIILLDVRSQSIL